MNQAVLLLGGNLSDRKESISSAIDSIVANCGTILKTSKLYESEAWGFKTKNNFLNQAIIIETKLKAEDLLDILQQIEKESGRKVKTSDKYESRIIDIDILFYNSDIINTERLTIPHPRLHIRKFTLNCLMDIIPDYIHPKLYKSISSLSKECVDNIKVWPYE